MAQPTNSTVPKIRFKGFVGEWEDKMLGAVADVTTGKLDANAMTPNGIYDFYTSGTKKYKIDIAAFIGPAITIAGNGATVGYMHLADGKFNAYQRTYVLRNFSADRSFIFYSTRIRLPKKISEEARTGNIPYIVMDMLTELGLSIPDLAEQTRIGGYFREVDRLIGLQQRKHDKLVTLKKAMLQKMFPQPGTPTPEIRFKGFEGDWVEKTLGELCEIVGGGTPSTAIREYWGGDIDWYSPTEIGDDVYASGSVKKITQTGLAKCSARMLPPNKTILFTSRAGIGDMAILIKEGCTNQGFQSMVLHDYIDPYFIFSMGHLIKAHALKYASGSTFLEVSSKQLAKMEIVLPNNNEQQKIGHYFRTLDALISKHAVQLAKLKQLKSACLERMFV